MQALTDWFPALKGPFAAALDIYQRISSTWILLQFGAIAVALGIAFLFTRRVSGGIKSLADNSRSGSLLRSWRKEIVERVTPIIFLIVIWIELLIFRQITWTGNTVILRLVASLTTAWIVINVLALIIRNRFLYRVVSIGLWLMAAASILGILPAATAFLDGIAFTIGSTRVSALRIMEALVLLGVLLWLAGLISRAIDAGLGRSRDLSPSLRVLIGKLARVLLTIAAVLFAISAVGIDLTALAVFSGAVGVGIGFGLQKSVSNFVSGITVLLDKSIKPGDVISLGETFGWITALNARYVSVVTRDGREHLIPNEQFVSETVINWSYSDEKVRIDVPFGTSYDADPHAVKRLVEAACCGVPRVLPSPRPIVHFMGMGDSSLDFVARVWIRDPVEGLANVRSSLLFAVWDVLKANAIEIPFPQRDLHVRGPVAVHLDGASRSDSGA